MNTKLIENIKRLETDELLYKVSNSMLTPNAHQVALHVLRERGIETEKLKQEPDDISQASAYGLETEDEKTLTKNTFVNFFLLLILPLSIYGLAVIEQQLVASNNVVVKLLLGALTLAITAGILKWSYNQLFNKEDKLSYAAKVPSFVSAILAALYVLFVVGYSVF